MGRGQVLPSRYDRSMSAAEEHAAAHRWEMAARCVIHARDAASLSVDGAAYAAATYRLAEFLLVGDKPAEGLQVLTALAVRNPESSQEAAYVALEAHAHLMLGNTELAWERLSPGQVKHGDSDPLLKLGMRAALRLGRLDEWCASNRTHLEGEEPETELIEAEVAMAEGQLQRARRILEESLQEIDQGRPSRPTRGWLERVFTLGRVLYFAGEEHAALTLCDEVIAGWYSRGERGRALEAEGLRTRIMLAIGIQPLPSVLTRGITYAQERGLRPLEARLLIARAESTGSAGDAAAQKDARTAMDLGLACAIPEIVALAGLALAKLDPSHSHYRLQTALMAAGSFAPLRTQCRLREVQMLCTSDWNKAVSKVDRVLADATRMGMRRESLVARSMVRQFSGVSS